MSHHEGEFQIEPPLSQGVGYGILVGVGAVFALGMSAVSWALSKYMNEIQDSEMYMTAKHSVKTGLTASAVVSSWTVVATLLTSSAYGYRYGVAAPYWYGAGCSIQILLFSVVAIELKRRAPNAHTFLQVMKVRYGTPGHVLFAAYSMVTQFLIAVSLLVGGSNLFAALTGVNRDAPCFLFPIGVVIYTLMGGIKATFITDWLHTVIIYIIMLMSLYFIYLSPDSPIGSIDRMWELLNEASLRHPVEGNADGSYLTMMSQNSAYIGLVFMGSGFTGPVDAQLFQKAIAADPAHTSMGYIIGGICWFSIPFVLASTYGLASRAIEAMPFFPTAPDQMNAFELGAGMPMPYTALALLGPGGAAAILLSVFMAVTSVMSSETVAVSALISYDIYKAYINPNASGAQVLRVSHWVTPAFAIVTSSVAVGFNHAGFSVEFLVTAFGILVTSAVVPIACTILWNKQSLAAVTISPVVGSLSGILAWTLTARSIYGEITIATLTGTLPLVAGNMTSLLSPLPLVFIISFLRPADFDFDILKTQITRGDDEVILVDGELIRRRDVDSSVLTGTGVEDCHDTDQENKLLLAARNRSIILSVVLTFILLVLIPLPMYGTGYIFSKGFFRGWIAIVFIWGTAAALVITILPIWEGRSEIAALCRFLTSRRSDTQGPQTILHGVSNPASGDEGPVSSKTLEDTREKSM